ncbi:MAG: DUF3467 domain-containing protein [Acidobacteria bacterium]|nr:MAG: DUF3467 domain-containing protein [Acidobacteriota bacterium]
MSSPGPNRPAVSVKIDDQTRRGVYANRVIVSHTPHEFVIDFVSDLPPGPQIVSRVVTAPVHAAALLDTLRENLGRYEQSFGPIRPPRPGAEA